jgi:dihydrofolate synthase / folylpolyglutamate synthase
MTHAARDYLTSLELHGIKLGLQNIHDLLNADANPHHHFPAVHVAGTNGKGSVVAFLDAMLRQAGYRTGRFTSPHILTLNERFTISGVPLSDDEIDEHIAVFRAIAESQRILPTFFELNTAIAFRAFDRHRVDIALVEVGMGGRFDATNVLEPRATAVTNIDLEHTRYLGDTLEKIAFEKAGIIKPAVPVVVGERRHAPLAVIREKARQCQAPVIQLDQDFAYELRGDDFNLTFTYKSPHLIVGPLPLALAGRHQGDNAAVAVALAEILRENYPCLTPSTITRGLEHAKWPCRLEKVLQDPPVIIDVAHNAAGAHRVAQALHGAVLVLAVSSDKDARAMLDALAPVSQRMILTEFQGPRALPVHQLAALAPELPHTTAPTLEKAIAEGLAAASAQHPLVITGSIFTAGQARQILMDQYNAPTLEF